MTTQEVTSWDSQVATSKQWITGYESEHVNMWYANRSGEFATLRFDFRHRPRFRHVRTSFADTPNFGAPPSLHSTNRQVALFERKKKWNLLFILAERWNLQWRTAGSSDCRRLANLCNQLHSRKTNRPPVCSSCILLLPVGRMHLEARRFLAFIWRLSSF